MVYLLLYKLQQMKPVGVKPVTLSKILCKLLLPAAVQVSTSGQACSQDEKMYSKKAAYSNTHTHPVSVECHHRDAQLDLSGHLALWWS